MRTASAVVALTAILPLTTACALPRVQRSGPPPTRQQLAQLWIDPGTAPRNLAAGVGGSHVRPRANERYEVVEKDTRGFSITYRVRDNAGAEWNVKIGPEAQTEVVASRILWGVGY